MSSSQLTAEIVSVGTEILLGQIVDSNAARLGELFAELGIRHVFRQTVGDNAERLTGALRLALSRADLVVTIGGLGPTEDDLTREAIAAALDEELVFDEEVAAWLKEVRAQRGLPWVESQLRQAYRPRSGRPIPNPHGTAPGLIVEKGAKTVIALPGPKGEFHPMVDGPVRDYLAGRSGGTIIHSRVLRVCGLGESVVESMLGELVRSTDPTVAPYAKPGEVHLRLTTAARDRDEAMAKIAPMEERIRAILGDAIFGVDATTLEEAVIEQLRVRGETVCVAESCTGGGLGARLTSVPGASAAFRGGIIAYENAVKVRLLGVPPDVLERVGAVSEECARAMAGGARERFGTTYAVSITGIAGPEGGTPEKPVGTVWIGVAGPKGVEAERHLFPGLREDVRRRSTQAALVALRRTMSASAPEGDRP